MGNANDARDAAIAEIVRLLKSGSTVELKLISGHVQIIEIRRKLKIKIPLDTGQAEG